jgi:hypothetical protein
MAVNYNREVLVLMELKTGPGQLAGNNQVTFTVSAALDLTTAAEEGIG